MKIILHGDEWTIKSRKRGVYSTLLPAGPNQPFSAALYCVCYETFLKICDNSRWDIGSVCLTSCLEQLWMFGLPQDEGSVWLTCNCFLYFCVNSKLQEFICSRVFYCFSLHLWKTLLPFEILKLKRLNQMNYSTGKQTNKIWVLKLVLVVSCDEYKPRKCYRCENFLLDACSDKKFLIIPISHIRNDWKAMWYALWTYFSHYTCIVPVCHISVKKVTCSLEYWL